jgi:hypothetical protein
MPVRVIEIGETWMVIGRIRKIRATELVVVPDSLIAGY